MMLTSPWQQKREQIAKTMQGTVAPGGLGLGNAGATFRANPMMSFGAPGQAAPAASAGPGLMGQAGGSSQMARMAQMPGFNYVPPPTGPAPVPQQQGGGMGGGQLSPFDMNSLVSSGMAMFAPQGQRDQMKKWFGGGGGTGRNLSRGGHR